MMAAGTPEAANSQAVINAAMTQAAMQQGSMQAFNPVLMPGFYFLFPPLPFTCHGDGLACAFSCMLPQVALDRLLIPVPCRRPSLQLKPESTTRTRARQRELNEAQALLEYHQEKTNKQW
eukprot:2056832-Pleurochrysis_carterae.AAC.1